MLYKGKPLSYWSQPVDPYRMPRCTILVCTDELERLRLLRADPDDEELIWVDFNIWVEKSHNPFDYVPGTIWMDEDGDCLFMNADGTDRSMSH